MTQPLPMGSIVHLTTCLIKAQIKSEETMPDTPSLYGADLELMNDRGYLDTTGLRGKPGLPGQTQMAFRRVEEEVGRPQDLPHNLTDAQSDLGKYWVISTRDTDGVVVEQWAYVWFGTVRGYRKTYMGARGPAGPVPKISPTTKLVDLRDDKDAVSYVETGGSIMSPTWRFNVAAPIGETGPVSKLNDYPDFVSNPNPPAGAVLMHDGTVGTASPVDGRPLFRPANIKALIPRVFSVPESSFSDYQGTWNNVRDSARVNVGSFTVPAQPFDWTPIVWGHTSTGVFANPWKIGLEVRLAKTDGLLLARGFGNRRGEVYVVPHYTHNSDKNAAVSPTNGYAKVEAGQDATVYMNLTNDGIFSVYNFNAKNAQLLIMVSPLDAYNSYTPPTTRRLP